MRTTNPTSLKIPASLTLLLASVLTACGGGIADSATAIAGVDTTEDAMAKIAAAGGVKGKPAPAPAPAPPPAPAPAPPPVTGSLTVDWVAPTTKADGTPLTDLAGFRILIGTTSGTYAQTVTVPSPTTLTYTVSNLPANTYYAVAKAYDSSNTESGPSIEVSKIIK